MRAFKGVGGNPVFMDRGDGSCIFDVDGNGYVDYVMSWGPLIFGHAPMFVREAITYAASRGTSFGASTAGEIGASPGRLWTPFPRSRRSASSAPARKPS